MSSDSAAHLYPEKLILPSLVHTRMQLWMLPVEPVCVLQRCATTPGPAAFFQGCGLSPSPEGSAVALNHCAWVGLGVLVASAAGVLIAVVDRAI
jgi:hypothetical protein